MGRVLHITLQKCGSQWVRDVFSAPELFRFSVLSYSGVAFNLQTTGCFEIPEGEFSGPVYNMCPAEWQVLKCPGDKAVVVLRDPRDRLVSHLFSLLYSHQANTLTENRRSVLSGIQSHHKRIELLICFTDIIRFYLTWSNYAEDDAFIVRYESLLQDQFGAFRRILDWIGWPVPDDVLQAVVERLSFKNRSGRSPGETDIFSHYRRGIEGDWRNHFSREHGRLWESLYPGFLTKIGYESSDDWWLSLPEEVGKTTPVLLSNANDIDPAIGNERIEILTQRIKRVEKQLDQKEQEIKTLTKACHERLELIERLDKDLKILLESGLNE